MRLVCNLTRQLGSFFAVLILSTGLDATGALVSAAEPARLVILSGEPAALLHTLYRPSVPVLVAGVDEDVIAVVFDEDPERAILLPDSLFSKEPVAGCPREGPIACCDERTGEMVLSATYKGEGGWLQLGELCQVADLETVDYLPVPEQLSGELNERFEVNDCLMELAGAEGEPLVLVNAPSQDSPLWSYCLALFAGLEGTVPTLARAPGRRGEIWLASVIMRRLTLRAPPPILPAASRARCQSQRPSNCIDKGYAVCAKKNDRWYKENDQGKWCRMNSACGPCS